MKRTTLETMISYLNGATVDTATLLSELTEEYNRLTAKSRANADLYANAEPVVLKTLDNTPRTVKDIFALCENELPDGFTASKVQYLMLHQLADKVNKQTNGKNANTYTRKM